MTHRLRKNIYLAALMPVVVNGLVIGLILSLLYQLPLFMTILTVSLGEAGVCYVLGVPLIKVEDPFGAEPSGFLVSWPGTHGRQVMHQQFGHGAVTAPSQRPRPSKSP